MPLFVSEGKHDPTLNQPIEFGKVFPMRMVQPPWTIPRIRTLYAESKSRSLGRLTSGDGIAAFLDKTRFNDLE